MKKRGVVLSLLLLGPGCEREADFREPTPPHAPRLERRVAAGDGEPHDPYSWLRDERRSDPAVLAHLEAENAYTEAMTAHLQPLMERLRAEFRARMPSAYDTDFRRDGDDLLWTRYRADAEHPVWMRRRGGEEGREEILLDVERLAAGSAAFRIGPQDLSPDGRWLAWLQDETGRFQYRLMLRDLVDGRTLDPAIGGVSSMSWAADSASLFYVVNAAGTLRPHRVMRYWPDAATAPQTVHDEHDPAFQVSVGRTRSDRYNLIRLHSTAATELRFIDSAGPQAELQTFLPRRRGHLYDIDHDGRQWIVRSNRGAPDFRILRVADGDHARPERWRELVPHRPGVVLHEFDAFESFLALAERVEGRRLLRVVDYRDGRSWTLDFDEVAHGAQLGRNPDVSGRRLQYAYSSLTTPRETWELEIDSGERRLLERLEVVGGFEPSALRSHRIWVEARDGARVPVSLVHRRDTPLDGSAPLLQTGYGAYGLIVEPVFSGARLSLLERGFVYAIAHVRGSQMMGRHGYEQGRLLDKMNSFTDFIDATRALVDRGLVDGSRVFASGASAGGLLVAVVANLAPQDYAGIVAHVPFVDVLGTMLDASLPLTAAEFDEWGDPNQAPFRAAIGAYSPYQNVRVQDYPAMLVTAGLWDQQVQYWEPVKWVARLRHRKTDDEPLLLHIDMNGGHGDPSGRFGRLDRIALEYAFVLDRAGLAH